jgi:hypothetical protein
MKLKAFLQRVPDTFAVEILEALPAPDRRELLRRHGAKVAVSAGSLKRATRLAKEAGLLVKALLRSEDPDEPRTFLQGWLARRAEMVVHFLDAWKVKHQGGIVDDFGWVQKLDVATVKQSLEGLDPKLEPVAPLVYFAYLELPVTEQALDVDAIITDLEKRHAASA